MSFPGITSTKFGHYPVAGPFRADRLHLHAGGPLREVEWPSPIPVLDQEDLFAQDIDTSALVPGAARVDALGSCTCNSGTAHLAQVVTATAGSTAALAGLMVSAAPSSPSVRLSVTNGRAGEEFAVVLYHLTTWQTGDPAREWPAQDCGSNGLYVMEMLERLGFIAGHKSASGITNVVSLMQGGSVMTGGPFFNSWTEPGSDGFVDGDGSVSALQAAISSGVGGSHETLLVALERLVLTETGQVDAAKSWARVRNSWSSSFGDRGDYRIHLSTLDMLGSHMDYKQAVPLAA